MSTAATEIQALTPAELERGRTYIDQTRALVVGATKGLSDAQWNFKPAAGEWSIAENLEHIVMVQDFILGPLCEQLAKAPAPAADRDVRDIDSLIINHVPNRLTKFKGPDPLMPSGKTTPAAALDRVHANSVQMIGLLESSPDLRAHCIEARPLKALSGGKYETADGYQWILLCAGHTERHVKQILEVKANANFPAN